MLIFMSILIGILYANLIEYCVHRYLFHGFGKSGSSVFAFHLRTHHSIARSNGFLDDRVSHNELLGLPIIVLIHSPFLVMWPAFFYTIAAYAFLFIVVHNVVHRYPLFAQRYYWWHWNHHMRNQNKSWGVVLPITDIIAGTLEDNRIETKNRRG